MAKRPDGALEREIMTVLWAAGGPLPAAEIRARLSTKLAYTSVATVLGRLHTKGLVRRAETGRAFAYEACIDGSRLAAQRMGEVLAGASDTGRVLAGFVGSLSKKDVRALRAMLGTEHE